MRWMASEGYLELDGSGQPARLHGVTMDITHRKQAELDAHEHRNEVAHLLRAASLGELSSALAHELSQPLTAILSNAQAAQLILAREGCELEEIRDILRDIVSDDKRAGEVIGRLRTLLKKGEFQPQPLEANEMIQEALKLMNHDLMAHAVRVVTELGIGLPSIRGDSVQVQQVLINLILNAVDAMSERAQNARTLTLGSCRLEDNSIRFSVADTGDGIAPGSEEKIFEPYHTTKPRGLGLGLSLSRSIVLAHGGTLVGGESARRRSGIPFHHPGMENVPGVECVGGNGLASEPGIAARDRRGGRAPECRLRGSTGFMFCRQSRRFGALDSAVTRIRSHAKVGR